MEEEAGVAEDGVGIGEEEEEEEGGGMKDREVTLDIKGTEDMGVVEDTVDTEENEDDTSISFVFCPKTDLTEFLIEYCFLSLDHKTVLCLHDCSFLELKLFLWKRILICTCLTRKVLIDVVCMEDQ